jgi:hypothetical protein
MPLAPEYCRTCDRELTVWDRRRLQVHCKDCRYVASYRAPHPRTADGRHRKNVAQRVWYAANKVEVQARARALRLVEKHAYDEDLDRRRHRRLALAALYLLRSAASSVGTRVKRVAEILEEPKEG